MKMTNKIYKACTQAIAEFPQRLISYVTALLLLMLVAGQAHAAHNAAFVSQTVPATMVAGEKYSVTVTMKNTGTTAWTVAAGYILGAQNPEGNGTWGTDRMPLGSTIPATSVKAFTMLVTAPSTPGIHQFQWQMVQDGVEFFGAMSPSVGVNVVPAVNNAQFVSQTVSTTMTAGGAYTANVTMKNTGNTTWKAGAYSIAQVGEADTWGIVVQPLTAALAPGVSRTFSIPVRAPVDPNYYNMQWQMLQNDVEWFGAPTTQLRIGVPGPAPMVAVDSPLSGTQFIVAASKINVPVYAYAVPTGAATISKIQVLVLGGDGSYGELGSVTGDVLERTFSISSGYRTIYIRATDSFNKYTQVPITLVPIADNASFVSQSVPAKMIPGQPYDVSVILKNNGTTTWDPETYRLTSQTPAGNVTWGSSTLSLPGPVGPGESVEFATTITAPPTVGTYTFQWRMSQDTRGAFGAYTTSVSVANARPLPIVTMAAPQNNEAFPVPTGTSASVPVQGYAVPAQGATISKIEVLEGTVVLATVAGEGIDIALPLAPGTHALRLRATDNWGIVGLGPITTITVKANAAAYSTQSVPTTMVAGRTYTPTVTMRNTGTTTWTPLSAANPEGYALGAQNPTDNDVWRVRVPTGASVGPGLSQTFSIAVTAPPPGTYNFQWQMAHEGHEWFGAITPNVQVVVKPAPPSIPVLASPLNGTKVIATAGKAEVAFSGSVVAGEWNAIAKLELLEGTVVLAAVEGETIEGVVLLGAGTRSVRLRATDIYGQVVYSGYSMVTIQTNNASFVLNEVPTTMVAGQNYTVGVTMRNNGNSVWSAAEKHMLGVQPEGNTTWTSTSTPIILDVANAGDAHFVWQITAPAEPGTYPFQWQMRHGDKEWFGVKSTLVNVVVTAAPPTATITAPVHNTSYPSAAGGAVVTVQGNGKAVGNAAITKLELLDGATVIATVNSGTINTNVTLAGGGHALKLRATDGRGNTGLSAGVTVNVLHNNASFVSQTVPTAMIGGERYSVTVTMKNNGNIAWQPFNAATRQGYALASQNPVDNTVWRADNRVPLATTVAANGNAVFTFDVIAPMTGGTYNFQWRMQEEATGAFGALSTNVAVVVTAPAPGAVLSTPVHGAAVFSADGKIRVQGIGTPTPGRSIAKIEVLDGATVAATVMAASIDTTLALTPGAHVLQLRVTDSFGAVTLSTPSTVTVQHLNAELVEAMLVKPTMVTGELYSVFVRYKNTGTTAIQPGVYSLGAQNPENNTVFEPQRSLTIDGTFAPGEEFSLIFSVKAPSVPGTYAMQWQLKHATAGWFGQPTANVAVAVTAPPGPTATLKATPGNSQVQFGQSAAIALTGSGDHTAGLVTKLEVFQDTGSGYAVTPVLTLTGSAASLALNQSLSLPYGSYRLKLRATDAGGRTGESVPVMVNVTDTRVTGTVKGMRVRAGRVELFGTVTQPAAAPPMSYAVYVKAPRALGGIEIATGVVAAAPVLAQESAQGQSVTRSRTSARMMLAVGAAAAGGDIQDVSMDFVVDMTPFETLYPGEPVYVEVKPTPEAAPVVLPSVDYTAVVPGTLRIGLTSPQPSNTDRIRYPDAAFLRAVVSGQQAPVDELHFSVDTAWVQGFDDQAGGYAAAMRDLPARIEPYTVYAQVRVGQMILQSDKHVFYVDPGNAVSLLTPTAGATLTQGVPVTLSAEPSGDLTLARGVTFYINGNIVGEGVYSAGRWTYSWTPSAPESAHILALVHNGAGATVSRSTLTSVTVVAPEVLPPELLPVSDVPWRITGEDAGTLTGALSVTPTGTAAYSLPLVVPPGTAGMQPELSLNYNSSGPNSVVGLGWSLGGLQGIQRCAKTFAQDGINGRLAFENTDRLCLNGLRLLLVNLPASDANYWSDGAEYRTEIESYARIRAQGTGMAARSFQVYAKDGRILTFGQDTGAVAAYGAAKSGAQSWALNRVEDRIGNYISYKYTQDTVTGEHLLSAVRYGGKGKPAHAAVRFEYEDRPDAWKRYIDETRNDLRKRISHIRTHVGNDLEVSVGTLVRDYALTYERSPTSGRSLLTQVKACARHPDNGTIECMPATTFAWGKPAPGKTPGFVSVGEWANAPVMTTHNYWDNKYWSTNHPDYFAFSDFDNDGFADVLEKRIASPVPDDLDSLEGMIRESRNSIAPGTMAAQYAYYHSTGKASTGFIKYNYQLSSGLPFVVLDVGDFNGDGAPDLLVRTSVGPAICTSPLNNPNVLGTSGSTITFDCNNTLSAVGDNTTVDQPYLVDVTGDGRSAHYSSLDTHDEAYLCVGSEACAIDPNPPRDVLNLGRRDFRMPVRPVRDFVSYTQMVDFTGVGKSYDVRWSSPHYYQAVDTDGSNYGDPEWLNPTPTISVTGFRKPGFDTVAEIKNYVYPEIPCIGDIVSCRRYMFQAPYQGAGMSADFNGSGYNSLAFGFIEFSQVPGPSYKRAETTVCLSTGRALDCAVRTKFSNTPSGNNYSLIHAIGNFIGDGQASLMVEKMSYETNSPRTTGLMQMCTLMGDDTTASAGSDSNMICRDWAVPILPAPDNPGTTAHDQAYFMDLMGTGRMQIVKYHSGKAVGNTWVGDDKWEVFEPLDLAEEKQALDRIHQVTDGFGSVSVVEYANGVAASLATVSTDAAYSYPQRLTPVVDKLVSRISIGNGVSGARTTSYSYRDAASDVRGRGPLGFAKVIATDEQTDIVTTTRYSHEWPHIGTPSESEVKYGSVVLAKSTDTLDFTLPVQGNGAQNWAPFVKKRKVQRKDLTGADLGTVTTDFDVDEFGNVESEVITSSSEDGKTFTVQSDRAFWKDATNWLIALPTAQSITSSANGGSPSVRNLNFEYDANGLLSKEIIEHNNALHEVTTTYVRTGNSFGLVDSKTQSWIDPVTGLVATRAVESATYDDRGRYPATVTKAIPGHVETHVYYPETGMRKSLTDPNQLTTTWTADGFGRVREEHRPGGGIIKHYLKRCSATLCPEVDTAAAVQTIEQFNGLHRTSQAQVSYSDSVGHLIRSQTVAFDGRATYVDRQYDGMGRNWWTSQPAYYSNASPEIASQLSYDVLGRVTLAITHDETGAQLRSTTNYNGMTTVLTNPRGHSRTEKRNVIGQLETVTDALGKTVKFEYDTFGNLVKTTDPLQHVIGVKYDLYGRKTELNDPDLGIIKYSVDPLGRVYKKLSPKGQETRFVHDKLDRMTSRVEADLTTTWVFDSAANGKGRLAETYTGAETNKDYQRSHRYDVLGRPSETIQTLGNVKYSSLIEYDDWGRLSAQVHKRDNGGEKRYTRRYNAKGYLSSIERGSLVLWQVSKQDPANRVIEATLGNGLVQKQGYDPYTARLDSIDLQAGTEVRLATDYRYDQNGNIKRRSQYWGAPGFDEDFTYDELNRLATSQVQGRAMLTFNYLDDGAIKSKSGMGTGDYVYPALATAARPHAVTSIPGVGAFEYDANGNLERGNGRDISWTSFDMPLVITKGGANSRFYYGSEHQRTLQTRSDGTSIWYAGAQEVESKNAQVTVKTYWPNGLGLEIDRPGQQTELRWTHLDHLGSPVAVTDQDGVLKDTLAYDAWGKRRSPDGASTPDELEGQVDNKGYTGHEMLDELDLVHMNGRVYDPQLAQFLSGDPLLQDPKNSQNYSRYSYVLNNPTNLTDPSGFSPIDTTVVISGKYLKWQLEESIEAGKRAYDRYLNQQAQKSVAKIAKVARVTPVGRAVLVGGLVGTNIGTWIYGKYSTQILEGIEYAFPIKAESQEGSSDALSADGTNTAPELPDDLVGDQSDPRAGPNKAGGKHTSGTLTEENGGNGDFLHDLEVLAGPVRPQKPGDKAPPGSLVGENGVFGRPDNKSGGSGIDIPGKGTKPHETLHYPKK